MNTKKTALLILLFTGIICGFSQTIVKNVDNLNHIPKNAIADVYGNITITENSGEQSFFEKASIDIEVFPNWPIIGNGHARRGGIYCNLDTDSDLEIVYVLGGTLHAWNFDGTYVPGWPQVLDYISKGAPSFGDVDGDGEEEIVVATGQSPYGYEGKLYVFEKDGTSTTGFPLDLPNGKPTETAILADLDNDNAMEILVDMSNYPDGYLTVYKGDGSVFPGWPIQYDGLPGCAPAVGDITGDDMPEIVVESYFSLYVFDVSGNILSGFPFTPGNDRVFSYSSPVLADIDGDGFREIIFGDHQTSGAMNGAVHILRNDGTIFPGWPQYTTHWVYGPPSIGDIDRDGTLDIAVGDQTGSSTPFNKVYVWDINGNYLPGWPTVPIMAINNQIILADLDGDNEIELMWDDNTSGAIYQGYNHDGTVMDGWPLDTQFYSFFINPFVTDVNNDGITDISGGGCDVNGTWDSPTYLWDTGADYHPELSELPVFQYNLQHTGVYVTPTSANVQDIIVEDSINISPNPSNGVFSVNIDLKQNDQEIFVDIIDVNGKIIQSSPIILNSNSFYEINISDHVEGVYFVKIMTNNQLYFQKIIKR